MKLTNYERFEIQAEAFRMIVTAMKMPNGKGEQTAL